MLHYFIEIDHIVAKYYLGPTLVPPADVSPPLLLLFLPTLVPRVDFSPPLLLKIMPTFVYPCRR